MKELQMGPVSISGDIMRIDSETGAICTNKKHWKKWGVAELRAILDDWPDAGVGMHRGLPKADAVAAFLEHLERSEQ